jgi:hypothetical protein
MKYLILIYDNAHSRERFSGPEGAELMAEMDALLKEITESGELVTTEALADPAQTKTIRLVEGTPAVTDGPFAEAKEHLGGFIQVDCATPERAWDIARRFPASRFTPLEVRPIMSPDGAEM